MPQRIADEVIERLKHSVSIERLAEARGVELKRHGADLIGRCPWHADKTRVSGTGPGDPIRFRYAITSGDCFLARLRIGNWPVELQVGRLY
jgi:hypothetical protein